MVGFVCATTPRCNEMARLISQDKEEPVSAIMAFRMKFHYKVCVWCERYRDQVAVISELSKAFGEADSGTPSLTIEAKERMSDAVKNEMK